MDQNGFVTTKQALGEGLSNASLATLVSRGRLRHVAHGVYRVPQVAETSLDEHQLAVLWTAVPEACLSHETALAVRGIGDFNPGIIHLTVARTRRIRRRGGERYLVHREDLLPRDIVWWEGIRTNGVPAAIRQCIESGAPTYLIKQALLESSNTSSLPSGDHSRLERVLKKQDGV